MRRRHGACRLALLGCLAVIAALASGRAGAVEPGGSKNFSPPGYVPNYFSNESGPFGGGANTRAAAPAMVPNLGTAAPRHRIAALDHHHSRPVIVRSRAAKSRVRLVHGRTIATHHLAHRAAHRHAAAGHEARQRGRFAQAPRAHTYRHAVAARGRAAPARQRRVARAG